MKRRAATTRRRVAKAGRTARAASARDAASTGEYSSLACYLHEVEPGASATPGGIRIKRIYEPADPTDGYRALIDRLWPRGISKQRAALDAWLTELAPSNQLRLWYGHDPRRWTEFGRRYRAELRSQGASLAALRSHAAAGPVTLLYASRELRINHAVVLRQVLLKSTAARRRRGP